MRETHIIIQSHLPKFCILHCPLVHVIGGYIVVHEFKMLLHVIFHTIPNYTLECMATVIPQPLAWNNKTGRRTLIPPQTNLNFLIQHQLTTIIPFENQLEIFVCHCSTTVHRAQACHAFLLNANVNIHATHHNCDGCLKVLYGKTGPLFSMRANEHSHPQSHCTRDQNQKCN